MSTKERVKFRLIKTPCCGHLLCWVNPRLPTYCPECGGMIFRELKFETGHILVDDSNAWLTHNAPEVLTKPSKSDKVHTDATNKYQE